MPNIKSAKKRIRNSEQKHLRNKATTSAIKTYSSRIIKLCKEGKKDEALPVFKKASSVIDKASLKRIIHKNTAARKKSKLAKLLK